jgi:hypothetical protein
MTSPIHTRACYGQPPDAGAEQAGIAIPRPVLVGMVARWRIEQMDQIV